MSGSPRPAADAKPSLPERIAARRGRHKQRSKVYRAGVVVAGFLITLAGLVMTGPVPGPGFLVIPVGLALLALEFDWAERLLVKAVEYAERQKRKAQAATPAQKIMSGVAAVLAIAAFVAAALLWDIPLLPF